MEFDVEFGLLINIPPNFSGIAMGTCEYNVAPQSNIFGGYSYSTPFNPSGDSGASVSNYNNKKTLNIPLEIHDHEVHLSNDNYTVEETGIMDGIRNVVNRLW